MRGLVLGRGKRAVHGIYSLIPWKYIHRLLYKKLIFYETVSSREDTKTCPHPLLTASPSFSQIPTFERPGDISCPFRIIPSVAGRRLYLLFNHLKGMVFDQKGEDEKFFKRISMTACYCNKAELIVGDEPVYVTSPGFPDLYCSNFRCKRKFLHNVSMHDDMSMTFVVTVHFLNTNKYDYVDFSTDGLFLERLNGTFEDVKLVMTGDVMETEFVTDRSISRHGYNMSVVSVRMPLECVCPHKGMKVMTPDGSLQMDVPAYCTIVYCKWEVPSHYDELQFTSMFNFSSEFDSLTVTTGSDVRRFTTVTGKQLRRHWKRMEYKLSTTILYQRAFPDNYTSDSKAASFTVKWMSTTGCNCNEGEPQLHEAVIDDWRELTSPDYPVPYCGDLECIYRIVAPTGHHVVLNITDFYTEPYNDVLALFDGVNTTGRHMDV
ncbi:CUB domain protein [Ancylostoma caninum]|uniref:CUB domain protein n=1 Tax=Ancylostoma caninum TaxID=29170 RepID=A0A368H7E8_ANCCA|nr:CUB domain protein [Ancylostoma caninum]